MLLREGISNIKDYFAFVSHPVFIVFPAAAEAISGPRAA